MSNCDNYNQEILNIWQSALWNQPDLFWSPLLKLNPLLIPTDPPRNTIIILGINPSHSEKMLSAMITSEDLELFFEPITSIQQPEAIRLKQVQIQMHNELPYFSQIKKFLTETCNINREACWFLDLFPIRHTAQHEAMVFLHNNQEIREQLLQSFIKLISSIAPAGLIILNATGSKLFADLFRDQLRYEANRRSEATLTLTKGCVPVVFAGMITGAGQMDSFSKERLAEDLKSHFASNV